MKKLATKIFKFLKSIFCNKCLSCKKGCVSHSHSEIFKHTTIEVYECNNCKKQYV